MKIIFTCEDTVYCMLSGNNTAEQLVRTETVWLVSGFLVLSPPACCNHQTYNVVSIHVHVSVFVVRQLKVLPSGSEKRYMLTDYPVVLH